MSKPTWEKRMQRDITRYLLAFFSALLLFVGSLSAMLWTMMAFPDSIHQAMDYSMGATGTIVGDNIG